MVLLVRLIANRLDLPVVGSAPKVRVFSSAGVTRPRQSYDPVRLPSEPPPASDVEAATLAQNGSPLITCITFPTCCPVPRRIETGASVDYFLARAAFPRRESIMPDV